MDISRMNFGDDFFASMQGAAEKAFGQMRELEGGAPINTTEKRMVGHYWLRAPQLAPTPELRADIEETNAQIKGFAADVHSGKIAGSGGKFRHLLLIGIGGSALGPQFVSDALAQASDPMTISFFDNTDPDGFDRVWSRLQHRESSGRPADERPLLTPSPGREHHLDETLVIVISKSGGTKETRNGMLEAEHHFRAAGLDFAKHAVAVTGKGSELDQHAEKSGWLARFPMHDWVGGRTSVMSAVGLVPMALLGFDIDQFLAGAAAMDERTRVAEVPNNGAILLALMWYYAGDGRGAKDMVILPYKDRLALFSKYLQQLVMESLGKAKDRAGKVVHQGIAVYGNKGSTDQHAYVQQLRDGVLNFFATLIEVQKDRAGADLRVEDDFTSGDYLHGFLRGTRTALHENGRESITISIAELNAFSLGALIALFERAVGFYGSLVNVNAYDQPGVESGKKAATEVLTLQQNLRTKLTRDPQTADDLAGDLGGDAEAIYHLLVHLSANDPRVQIKRGGSVKADSFFVK
ncbi:MAG: glucose-6-phosphate isomerase [Verrucomicrobiota bacterium]